MKTEPEIARPVAWEMTTAAAASAAPHSMEALSADRLRPMPSSKDLMDDVDQKMQIEYSIRATVHNVNSEEVRK